MISLTLLFNSFVSKLVSPGQLFLLPRCGREIKNKPIPGSESNFGEIMYSTEKGESITHLEILLRPCDPKGHDAELGPPPQYQKWM